MFRDLIHTQDPYAWFDSEEHKPSMHGWGGDNDFVREMVRKYAPSRIVEVGTWKGQSAISMALEAKRIGLECEIVCVDTWLGAEEFWLDKCDQDRYVSLRLKNGFPQVYYTFLANVIEADVQDIITPFPLASVQAAKVFNHFGEGADMVYIDASHYYPAVLSDLHAWNSIAERVMWGHDIWMGDVKRAVEEYKAEFPQFSNYYDHTEWWVLEF